MSDPTIVLNSYYQSEYNDFIRVLQHTGTEAHFWISHNNETIDANTFPDIFLPIYDIKGQLKIHPIALIQLKKEEKDEIIEKAQLLNNNDEDIMTFLDVKNNTRHIKCMSILKTYEIQYDRLIHFREIWLSKIFKPDYLRDVKINDRAIFVNIRPFEIKRLYDLFRNNDKMTRFVEAIKIFAQINEVNNVADFCACGDYLYKELKKRTKEQTNNNSNLSQAAILDTVLQMFQTNEEFQMECYNSYNVLVDRFAILMQAEGLHFSSPMTAATHFSKHWGLLNSSTLDSEEPEKAYLRLVREQLTLTPPITKWTQDGRSLKHVYKHECKMLIVIENASTNEKNIATFYLD